MQQVNLYQPMFRRERHALSAVAMGYILFVLIGALAIMSAHGYWRHWQLSGEVAEAEALRSGAEQRLEAARREFPPKEKSELLERELAASERELAAYRDIDQVLSSGSYGNTDGFSPRLIALARQRVDGAWLTNIFMGSGGTSISLAGRAVAPEFVPIYMQRLSRETPFAGQGFGTLEISRDAETPMTVGFRLTTLDGGIESTNVTGQGG